LGFAVVELKWSVDQFWSTTLQEWLLILEYVNGRDKNNQPMTKDRLAELEAQYPDVPRKAKANG